MGIDPFFVSLLKPYTMNGSKIRMIRELRGFSQETIAAKLGITQTTYSRLENNQTKLDTGMLEKIAREFGVSSADILSNEPAVVNFSSIQTGRAFSADNSFLFQKDLVEKLILSKDQEINNLKEVIAGLMKSKEDLLKLLQLKEGK
jgi:transcriptional regulator with XRE-family HTH domain